MERVKGKYETAKERVEEIKGFYQHLFIYLLINLVILVLRIPILRFLVNQNPDMDQGFQNWLETNMLLTPAIWGLALAVHAACVFKFKVGFLRSWEERKIKELMEQDDAAVQKYN